MRLGAILLSALLLMQSFHITVTDLARVDDLMAHMRYHQEQFGDDLLSFFSKHYGEEKAEHQKNHREERPDHEQLPFQHITHVHAPQTLDFSGVVSLPVPPVADIEKVLPFHYPTITTALYTSGIFQPPRQA